MRGFFAIGIDGVSKAGNMGNLIRTAHAFGAAFAFSIRSDIPKDGPRSLARSHSDTSDSPASLPFYEYESLSELHLPRGCKLVGIEITDDAVELPNFRHPSQAAYILGSERFSLSDAVAAKCDFMIKIPTKFSLNVATAGAIVMYDRLRMGGSFSGRPVTPGGKRIEKAEHLHGEPRMRKMRKR